MRTDFATSTIGDANAADVAGGKRPAGAHIGAQAIVLCFKVERHDSDTT